MPLKNCKDLTMKLQVKYLFPTSSSGTHFYIHQFSEGLGMGNILAHGLRMQKKPQTSANIYGFSWKFMNLCRSKNRLAPPQENFSKGVANLKNLYWLLKDFAENFT